MKQKLIRPLMAVALVTVIHSSTALACAPQNPMWEPMTYEDCLEHPACDPVPQEWMPHPEGWPRWAERADGVAKLLAQYDPDSDMEPAPITPEGWPKRAERADGVAKLLALHQAAIPDPAFMLALAPAPTP